MTGAEGQFRRGRPRNRESFGWLATCRGSGSDPASSRSANAAGRRRFCRRRVLSWADSRAFRCGLT